MSIASPLGTFFGSRQDDPRDDINAVQISTTKTTTTGTQLESQNNNNINNVMAESDHVVEDMPNNHKINPPNDPLSPRADDTPQRHIPSRLFQYPLRDYQLQQQNGVENQALQQQDSGPAKGPLGHHVGNHLGTLGSRKDRDMDLLQLRNTNPLYQVRYMHKKVGSRDHANPQNDQQQPPNISNEPIDVTMRDASELPNPPNPSNPSNPSHPLPTRSQSINTNLHGYLNGPGHSRPGSRASISNHKNATDDIRARISRITAMHARSSSLSSIGSNYGSPKVRRSISPPQPLNKENKQYKNQEELQDKREAEEEAERLFGGFDLSDSNLGSVNASLNPSVASSSRPASRLTMANMREHDRRTMEEQGQRVSFGDEHFSLNLGTNVGTNVVTQQPSDPNTNGAINHSENGTMNRAVNLWDSFDKLVGDEATLNKAIQLLFEESKQRGLEANQMDFGPDSATPTAPTHNEPKENIDDNGLFSPESLGSKRRLNSIDQLRTLCLDIERTKRILDSAEQRHKLQCELQSLLDDSFTTSTPNSKATKQPHESSTQSHILKSIDETLKKTHAQAQNQEVNQESAEVPSNKPKEELGKILERKLKPSPEIKSSSEQQLQHEQELGKGAKDTKDLPRTPQPRISPPKRDTNKPNTKQETRKRPAATISSSGSSSHTGHILRCLSALDKCISLVILIAGYVYINEHMPILSIVEYFKEVDRLYSYAVPILSVCIIAIPTSRLQITLPFRNCLTTLLHVAALISFGYCLLAWIRLHNYYYVRCKLDNLKSAGLLGALAYPDPYPSVSTCFYGDRQNGTSWLIGGTRRVAAVVESFLSPTQCPSMPDPRGDVSSLGAEL